MKPRKKNLYETVDNKYFIFCEGEKTEVIYFESFKAHIESNPIYKNSVSIEIAGLGANTMNVVEYADDFIQKNKIKNACVWCVFDKDSFPDDRFNSAVSKTESLSKNNLKYRAAWSNQCFEYWFILHFDYYDSDNHREYYIEYLSKKFKSFGLDKYAKNKDVFDILLEYGKPHLAIRYAKRRLQECEGSTPSNSAPATKVFEIVEELTKYLPKKISDTFEYPKTRKNCEIRYRGANLANA